MSANIVNSHHFFVLLLMILIRFVIYENEVLSNIMARRSIRKYLDKPVEHEKLEAVAPRCFESKIHQVKKTCEDLIKAPDLRKCKPGALG